MFLFLRNCVRKGKLKKAELKRKPNLNQNWKVIEKLEVVSEKWKKKLKSWKPKTKVLFVSFFITFSVFDYIAWTFQKFHFASYSLLQKYLRKVESFKWKAKKSLKVKSEKQKWNKSVKSWKLKAKSIILKTASEKQKQKFYDFTFQLWSKYYSALY